MVTVVGLVISGNMDGDLILHPQLYSDGLAVHAGCANM